MNIKQKVAIGFLFIFVVGVLLLDAQRYSYPAPEEIRQRLNYLRRVIQQPLEQEAEVVQLGRENPEFILFSYAFSTYALTNLAVRDSAYKQEAIGLIKESITKALDVKIAAPFGIHNTLNATQTIPDYSVLYLGHLNLMMGCYRRLSADTTFNQLNDNISQSLFGRYNHTAFLNLASYPAAIWIPDNAVAVASLKLHSFNTGSPYQSVCTKWVRHAKTHYLDKKTGVLYSTISSETGAPLEEPRGAMLGWSIMFIYQFDNDFAVALYENYKKNFSTNFAIFRLFRERSGNYSTSAGDMDSGPIVAGFSMPANQFALSNAVLAGDYKTARKLERLIDFGTSKIKQNNELHYKVRFVEMNISPMAEALVLHALTITNWTAPEQPTTAARRPL